MATDKEQNKLCMQSKWLSLIEGFLGDMPQQKKQELHKAQHWKPIIIEYTFPISSVCYDGDFINKQKKSIDEWSYSVVSSSDPNNKSIFIFIYLFTFIYS